VCVRARILKRERDGKLRVGSSFWMHLLKDGIDMPRKRLRRKEDPSKLLDFLRLLYMRIQAPRPKQSLNYTTQLFFGCSASYGISLQIRLSVLGNASLESISFNYKFTYTGIEIVYFWTLPTSAPKRTYN
jgi:hypothetical protein